MDIKKTGKILFSSTIITIITVTVIILLLFVSCEKETANADSDIALFENGESSYVIVVASTYGEDYEKALNTLQDAFFANFGTRLEVMVHPDPSKEAPDYNGYNVIFLGDIVGDYPVIETAKGMLEEGGFAAAVNGSSLALYASSEKLLLELCELFSEKYIKNENSSLVLERTFTLCRQFSSFDAPDGRENDFTLPVISVKTKNGSPIISTRRYLDASVSVSNTYGEFKLTQVGAKIRGRGNGTWNSQNNKKPYKLKFDNKVNLLGAGGGNSREWALLANPVDYSQLRNRVALTLAKTVFSNIDFTPGSTYAILYVNDSYCGVYLVCEQAEASSHKIKVEENENDAYSSEYLIELDEYAANGSEGYVNFVDYFSCQGKYWAIKSDFNTTERCMFVYYRMNDMMKAIQNGDEEQILSYIDISSCVDMYLLHEFMKNTDVGWSSFYMVLRTDRKFYFTCPWDFDLSSGNDARIDNGSYEGLHAGNSENIVMQSNPIFYMLMQCDFFRQLVAERWKEISSELLSVALGEIDAVLAEHKTDFVEDFGENYNNNTHLHNPEKIYESNVEHLVNWLQNRFSWLDRYFDSVL